MRAVLYYCYELNPMPRAAGTRGEAATASGGGAPRRHRCMQLQTPQQWRRDQSVQLIIQDATQSCHMHERRTRCWLSYGSHDPKPLLPIPGLLLLHACVSRCTVSASGTLNLVHSRGTFLMINFINFKIKSAPPPHSSRVCMLSIRWV
jgi:hypothetical protein